MPHLSNFDIMFPLVCRVDLAMQIIYLCNFIDHQQSFYLDGFVLDAHIKKNTAGNIRDIERDDDHIAKLLR